MALIRVAQYSSTPTVVTDYQAQNAHLQAFTNQLMTQQFILDSGTAQPVIKQGCYVSHGGSLYVADADTAITGSPADGSVYIRVSGTTSLTVEFVNDISGYTWNHVYTALTSGSYTLLPYLIAKSGSTWTRYNFNPNNQQFGAVACTSVNTGYGANEVYKISRETIDFGAMTIDLDKYISAFSSNEIRFVSITGYILPQVDGNPRPTARLFLPSGYSYDVVGWMNGGSNTGILDGGAQIFSREGAISSGSNLYLTASWIIKRTT